MFLVALSFISGNSCPTDKPCANGEFHSRKMELPSKSALKKVIHRVRKINRSAPATPTERSTLVAPTQHSACQFEDSDFENFLVAVSRVGDANWILIYGRKSVAERIGYVYKVYVDGTFSLASKILDQVFTILGERSGFVVPVCYALLPGKKKATYKRMVELPRAIWPQFQPRQVSVDFELENINAYKWAFPAVEIKWCFFHLVRNMNAKLASLGLMRRHNEDSIFALLLAREGEEELPHG